MTTTSRTTCSETAHSTCYTSSDFCCRSTRWTRSHTSRRTTAVSRRSRVCSTSTRGASGHPTPSSPRQANTVTSAVDDAIVVLDNVGSEQAAVVAWRRERGRSRSRSRRGSRTGCRRSFSVNAYARMTAADDYPDGFPPELDREVRLDERRSGSAVDCRRLRRRRAVRCRAWQDDARFREWLRHASRRGASPANARDYLAMTALADVRDAAAGSSACRRSSSIDATTSSCHGASAATSREHIPGANFVAGARP